ncbi:MAG: response regulator [Candidatus Omnitrophica bacterium]|nr:response regulator [Candidatus Omnitrophota bacterium]
MRILIADDEQTNIALIKAALKDLDGEFLLARDGQEAITLAKREAPDIIILDVMMPKLDGYKVCGMLKADKRFARIPVVILSSRAGEDDVEIAREVGADAHMVKPFDQAELSRNVKRLLNRSA